MRVFIKIIAIVILVSCKDSLSKEEIKIDLKYLEGIIEKNSSYAGLNGYDYKKEFRHYIDSIKGITTKVEFGKFLTQSIGKIGDRHSNVRDYDLPKSKSFPFAFASYNNRIVVLEPDKANNRYKIYAPNYPFLKAIEGTPINDIMFKSLPEEIKAPKDAYIARFAKELRDIEEIYSVLAKKCPNTIEITLNKDDSNLDTTLKVKLVKRRNSPTKWREKFYSKLKKLNKEEIVPELFSLEDEIAYFIIPTMFKKHKESSLFQYLNEFMKQIHNESKAMIIDVRSNGGGVRDLIWEMAGYFVHPDSIYVVNACRQRGEIPLNDDIKKSLHARYLFAYDELNSKEQQAVKRFKKSFKPMYSLDNKKYSEFYYAIFNGNKLSKNKYHYDKPIYILANERSFSAASVLVATFKGLPNVTITGITTDGSSGNSRIFYLPNSKLRVKLSTMVSFQKDGKILDGYGTKPDIKIKKDLDQILWKSDTQLETLKEKIKENFR